MTFLEKAKTINPTIDEETILAVYCPCSFDLEEDNNCESIDRKKCVDCWNREIPNMEKKMDRIPVIPQSEVEASQNGYRQGRSEGYEQGLNDAWELARKIWDSSDSEKQKIYGTFLLKDILHKLTPQEALAKLKAYEDSKIKVGDIIEMNGEKAVVTSFGTDNNAIHVMYFDGIVNSYRNDINCIKKTGKHIDIQSILNQIGGA